MPRPHDAEVAMVERRKLRLAEPLNDRENRAVDEADLQIAVGVQQLPHPFVVLCDQILDDQRASSKLVEHRAEGTLAGVGAEQMVHLDQDRGGDDAPLARRFGEQLRAALVRLVVAVESADQDRRVEDQRDGRGSKTSSAASLLRSPRPELNAPMQVSGGCSPSSFALERLSLPASANSCSSASRTSSGTSTPRSRAARCARSRRSASIWMLVLAVEAIARKVSVRLGSTGGSLADAPLTAKRSSAR